MKKVLFTLSLIGLLFYSTAHAYNQNQIEIKTSAVTKEFNEQTVDRYSYNFGRVWINSAQTITYRLKNTGTTDLTFDYARISGADYRATHNCHEGLHPGAQCIFKIQFYPFFEGFQSGQFVLAFKEDFSIVVQLWGEGVRF